MSWHSTELQHILNKCNMSRSMSPLGVLKTIISPERSALSRHPYPWDCQKMYAMLSQAFIFHVQAACSKPILRPWETWHNPKKSYAQLVKVACSFPETHSPQDYATFSSQFHGRPGLFAAGWSRNAHSSLVLTHSMSHCAHLLNCLHGHLLYRLLRLMSQARPCAGGPRSCQHDPLSSNNNMQ